MKFIRELSPKDLEGKKVLVRVDFNLPITSAGKILDDFRIKASLKTIKYLLQSRVEKVILISHLGRPVVRSKEKIEKIVSGNRNLILEPMARKLADWLKIKSKPKSIFIDKINFPAYQLAKKLILLENIRFDAGEVPTHRPESVGGSGSRPEGVGKKNDEFARELASLGDIYVNDAFAVCHRQQASIVGISKFLPSYAGFLIGKEIKILDKLLTNPQKPFVLILGGAKVYDKMMVLKNLLKKVDFILLGGVMANTFMRARGIDVKKSVVENERMELANKLFNRAARKFILPTTLVWDKERIVDVDPRAIQQWKRYFDKAKTIFWNGTMGLTSLGIHKFTRGSAEIAKMMVESKAVTIVSGGDTIAEVNRLKLASKMTFISTGGGATLEYLAGNKLPGLEALK